MTADFEPDQHDSTAVGIGTSASGAGDDDSRAAQLERELDLNEQRFRALVEASAQIVWSSDDAGKMIDDAPSWRDFTGASEAEWRDAGLIGGLHPSDQPAASRAWEHALATREPMTVEARVFHADSDDWRWTTISAVPLDADSGTTLGWVGTITDIDQRKRAEQQLRAMASAVTLAEQRERTRVAQVLHDDLQQLLHSVQMKLGIIQRSIERAGDTSEAIADVTEAGTWIGEGIEMSRRLSVELSPPVLDTDDLADTLRWLFEHMRTMHGIDVDFSAPDVVTAHNKDMQILLYQGVRELLFNVVKHAGSSHARVVVDEVDGELRITVDDEGQGFDMDERDPFVAPGSGLLRVRNRLMLFGGRLEVRSIPDDGTHAELRLPLERLSDHRTEAG